MGGIATYLELCSMFYKSSIRTCSLSYFYLYLLKKEHLMSSEFAQYKVFVIPICVSSFIIVSAVPQQAWERWYLWNEAIIIMTLWNIEFVKHLQWKSHCFRETARSFLYWPHYTNSTMHRDNDLTIIKYNIISIFTI